MIAYKLFRLRKDGTLGPLFINSKQVIEPGIRYRAETHETKGFSVRHGWHCVRQPKAPHLSPHGRVWARVSVTGVTKHRRPSSQGGLWYTAETMKVLDFVDFASIRSQMRFAELRSGKELIWSANGNEVTFYTIAYDESGKPVAEFSELTLPMTLFTTKEVRR